ncbi:carbamoyltransferase HypF, partial [Arcobacter aquimarinus]
MRTFKLQIKGIVQGVGFRPFVYNLALKHHIKGWVNNDDKGVNILLYASYSNINLFIEELKQNPPKLSKINEINIEEITFLEEFKSFEIKQSLNTNNKSTIISADIAICDECIEDINDVSNHRYNYTLTNCINCGPRYSIINTVPYDRCNTSMKEFLLCPKCKDEYK